MNELHPPKLIPSGRTIPLSKARGSRLGTAALCRLCLVGTLLPTLTPPVEAFTFHWEVDTTPEGSESATLVKPVRVLLADQLLEVAPHSSSLQLMKKYSVHLDGEWSSGHAYSLLRTFESIPQETNDPYAAERRVSASVWRLTHEHVPDDLVVTFDNGQRIVTVAQEAFVHSEALLAEIDGVRGRFFSKRLHRAVVRFVTEAGADGTALRRILGERYGVSLDVPDYGLLTQATTGETAGRFSEFKNEELLFLVSMLEEFPEGLRLTPGLRYLVRRLDGTPHPLYPTAPAVAWPTEGYIEFMESAFKGQGPASIHRLILHEKAHFLWEHLFDDQLKQDWIELGGWYPNPDDADGWSTTKQFEFVSAYAHGKNPNEDLAESISYYMVTPDKLRSRAPAKYEFIQNRIMHGTRYLSRIRQDLTFQVYNLWPDVIYPGKIIRVDIQVDGEPEEDKRVTIEVELHHTGDQDHHAEASHMRVFSAQGTFFDVLLHPIDGHGQRVEAGHILRGVENLSKYVASGYWAPDQVTFRDAQGNERHEGQTDFGWKLYVDNPLADTTAPQYVKGSARLSLSAATEDGRPYQMLKARWQLFEENGIDRLDVWVNDGAPGTYSYSRRLTGISPRDDSLSVDGGYGTYDPATAEATVSVPIPDYFPSGSYSLTFIYMSDVARNITGVYFTPDYNPRPEEVVVDEDPQTIEIQTTSPDLTPVELDVNRITIQAEPTRPEAPDGETRVDISFWVRDNISGYHKSNLYLRDPQGTEHHFRHYHHYHKVYFQGDPTAWQTYHKTVVLPVGSIPGIWGLAQMTLEDKAQNILRVDFTETLRFEITHTDNQIAHAIPQALRKVAGDEQTAPAGEPLAEPFVVTVLDQRGAAYPGARVAFKVTGGQGRLSVDTVATDAQGEAATLLTLGRRIGATTVEALVAGLPPVTFTARATPTAQQLAVVSGDGQQAAVGKPLPAPFVVAVLDQSGAPFPGEVVAFEVTAGGGLLSANADTTDAEGRATSRLTLGEDLELYAVQATVVGLDPVIFTATATPTSDFDGDGVTAFPDFFLFAEHFGSGDPRFDLDASGEVDFADFFLFAEHFGQPVRTKLVALAREKIGLPGTPGLQQNIPNPFNSRTVITWLQLEPGVTLLDVFALTGQRVAVLHTGPQRAGLHRLGWDGRDDQGRPLASGVYVYRLVTAEGAMTRKLTLLR